MPPDTLIRTFAAKTPSKSMHHNYDLGKTSQPIDLMIAKFLHERNPEI
jgi:hypothetical protein